ncbi:MAG: type IV toxin-antitoxin system AbiEi family antitoxin domain-containing protein [Armatimonadetes bacterium]|nr:type IV toxin-antitoxin system AbiEi family antitoxin domain-containing protein [Armatimonadota bacterium]
MTQTTAQQVLQLAQDRGLLRPRDLTPLGISPTHLQRLYEQGLLLRSGRGVYMLSEAELEANSALAEVALRVPAGVVCLLSALQFHELTTQLPHQVWIALPPRAHRPQIDYPPVRVIRLSGEGFTEGVETHTVSGVPVCVYSPAKTVADCFKYRNKIGLDVALEALRDCWRKRAATMDDLWRYATICRVANVMRPYLESLTT